MISDTMHAVATPSKADSASAISNATGGANAVRGNNAVGDNNAVGGEFAADESNQSRSVECLEKTSICGPVADSSLDQFTLTNLKRNRHAVAAFTCNRYMLWIDGVGAWQICMGDSVVLGAPSGEKQPADIALLANVSRQHATITRSTDDWTLDAHQATYVSGNIVASRVSLHSGDEIRLGESVRLGFRVPSVLSTSAVIDFESEHRPSHSVDGVILLTDHCLLGPRKDHHICCSGWLDAVVLFRRGNELRCRSKSTLFVNDKIVSDSELLTHGDTVSGEEFRFRIEQMD